MKRTPKRICFGHKIAAFLVMILTLLPLTMQGAAEAERKGYSTLHLRILSNEGQVLRPVSILLLNEEAGLRIEVSRAEARDPASMGNKKSSAPFDEVTIFAVPYGSYRVVVKSPLFLQLETRIEIEVKVPVFSRSIILAPNLPMIQWTVDPSPRTTLQVEDHAVPQAFAWGQLRHLHRVADPIEGRLDENGSTAVPELAAGEYGLLISRHGMPRDSQERVRIREVGSQDW